MHSLTQPNVLRKRSEPFITPNSVDFESIGPTSLEEQPQRRRLLTKRPSPPAVDMPDKWNQNGNGIPPQAEAHDLRKPPGATQRPLAPPRQPSYQKRHASFDSPREVPLPTPTIPESPFRFVDSHHSPSHGEYPTFDQSSEADTDSTTSLPRGPPPPSFEGMSSKAEPSSIYAPQQPSGTGPVFPNVSRPYSLPGVHSKSYGSSEALVTSKLTSPTPDRSSSASLPLPSQTPYFALPKVANVATLEEGREWSEAGPSTAREPTRTRGPTRTTASPSAPKPPPLLPVPVPESISARLSQALSLAAANSASSSTEPKATSPVTSPVSPTSSMPTAMKMSGRAPSHASMSPISSTVSFPPPQPPTILTPAEPAPVEDTARAPYEPFLSHSPPPEDSWIAVETTLREYRLVVRLPGFNRDGITLATRRRRILHVVADSWRPGGGHFERRISFGYDADLTQVRAEFNGEMLMVIVPRRLSPVNMMYPPSMSAPGAERL